MLEECLKQLTHLSPTPSPYFCSISIISSNTVECFSRSMNRICCFCLVSCFFCDQSQCQYRFRVLLFLRTDLLELSQSLIPVISAAFASILDVFLAQLLLYLLLLKKIGTLLVSYKQSNSLNSRFVIYFAANFKFLLVFYLLQVLYYFVVSSALFISIERRFAVGSRDTCNSMWR